MNFERKMRWNGLLLSLILFNHILISTAESIEFLHPRRNRRLERCKDDERFILGKNGKNDVSVQKDMCLKNQREKRAIIAILFFASTIVSLANIGFDIYLAIEGCQGTYPSIKTNVDEFERIRVSLSKRAGDMNTHYLQSKNILEYTNTANVANKGILIQVERIMKVSGSIMELLSPTSVIAFYETSRKIQEELKKRNSTAQHWNYQQLNTKYKGIFGDWKTALLGIAPVVGPIGSLAITKLFGWYKLTKITQSVSTTSTQLATSAKARSMFGVTNVKSAISATAQAQQKGLQAAAVTSKFARFAGAAMSVISIGLELYSAFQKIRECQKQRDQAKKALDEIKPEEAEFTKTENKLEEFRNNITSIYNEVKSQLTSKKFEDYIRLIQNITTGGDRTPEKMIQASRNMSLFLNEIDRAGYDRTNKLQNMLDIALTSVTYTVECLEKKIETVSYVYRECKVGKGTMKFIFDFALKLYNANDLKCTTQSGQMYTTFDPTNTYVRSRMVKEGYQEDCVLNSADMQRLTCKYYTRDYTKTEIQEKTGLTLTQVEHFVALCPPAEITPALETKLCFMKAYFNINFVKSMYSKYDQVELENIYNACPLPATMPAAVQSIICSRKEKGDSFEQISTQFNMYSSSAVRDVYNKCTSSTIPSEIRANICERRRTGASLAEVIGSYSIYTESKVTEVYNNC